MPFRLVSYRFASRVRTRATLFLFALVLSVTAFACGEGEDPDGSEVVASVGDEEITVDQLATYMTERGFGVNRGDAQRALDEMVDARLVRERARERHELTPVESLQVNEWREILTLNQFREDVIYADVEVDEAALREWYEENAGEQVRARHILIRANEEMSPEEREVARARADSLLEVARSGADFAALARESSEDPGSAQRGGDLGFFDRSDMVAPFSNAAFETEPGTVHPQVVESPFGFHVIKVEERTRPEFEEMRDEIESELAGPLRSEAQNEYIVDLMETSGLEFYEQNVDRLIALIASADTTGPSDEERAAKLATFEGGEITLGEIWDLYVTLPPVNRAQIEQLDQARMIQALSAITQQKILLRRAEEANTVLDSTRQAQLDDRIGQLYYNAYLREAVREKLEVPDSLVRRYYDEHQEFYRDESFEDVEQQIRTTLAAQRLDHASSPEAQRELVRAIADSQTSEMNVRRNTDLLDRVLDRVRQKYEESGTVPNEGGQGGGVVPGGQPAAPPQGGATNGQGR